MKTKLIAAGLFVLAASSVAVNAEDNPSQAAARSALVQKLFEPTPSPVQPTPRWDSGEGPNKLAPSVNRTTAPVTTNTPPPPSATMTTNLIAAPAKKAAPVIATPLALPPAKPQPPAAPATTPRTNVTLIGRLSSPPPALGQPGINDLVTTTGAIYRAAKVEKVEADGLIVSYVPTGGGVAVTKVYFEDLPDELRKQYQKKK